MSKIVDDEKALKEAHKKYVGVYHYDGTLVIRVEAKNEKEAATKMQSVFENMDPEELSANLNNAFLEGVKEDDE